MTRLAVVGGGLGGLAVSLFAARRGHEVVLLEADEMPGDDHVRHRGGPWYRHGVPQALHSHTFLGRSAAILAEEAPDVLASLAKSVHRLDFTGRFAGGDLVPQDGDEALWAIGCRRRTFERAVLSAVMSDPQVTMLWGHAVTSLITSSTHTGIRRIVGVRTSGGIDIRADLVVDASGVRTKAAQLLERAADVHPVTSSEDSGFTYFTRWYKLREGAKFPIQQCLPFADGSFATVATFPADDGHFSLTYMAPSAEPLRPALRDARTFETVLSRFQLTEPWLDPVTAEPVSDVCITRGGNERQLVLAPDGQPLVSGFVCVADAAFSTNPTRGRGTSMAFLHAQSLARLADVAQDDPPAFATAFAQETRAELHPWYESTVAFDRSRLRRLEAGLQQHSSTAIDAFELAVCSFSAYAERDPVLYRALVRILNMLATSEEAMSSPDVRSHLNTASEQWGQVAEFAGPNRGEFESICSAARVAVR